MDWANSGFYGVWDWHLDCSIEGREIENMKEQAVKQAMIFLCSLATGTTTLKTYEVDYWLENFSDTVFVNGVLRRVVFDKITDKNYKVYTVKI